MTHPLNGKKILVLTSASTGNNVFCTPAIHLLRKHLPQADIQVVALNKLVAQVFTDNTDINALHVISKTRHFDKLAQTFDHVLVLNKNALKKLPRLQTTYKMVPELNNDEHHADQLLAFVANWLGVQVAEEDKRYYIGTRQDAKAYLASLGIAGSDTVINLHLGCGTTLLHGWKFFYSRRADDKKLWSIDAYIALGKALHARIPKLKIVVTGTSNESFLVKKFVKQMPETINLVGKTTVSDLRAIMERANLFIAHDCGVLHIAAASDVPIVALFGPTNEKLTGPYPLRPQHCLIKKAQMTDIMPSEVADAAVKLLTTSKNQ